MAVHTELDIYCQMRKTKIKTESKVPHFEQVFGIAVPFTSSCYVSKALDQPVCPILDSAYTNDDPTEPPQHQPLYV